MFAIIHNLSLIVKWGQDAFRKWFNREVLGGNWQIVEENEKDNVEE